MRSPVRNHFSLPALATALAALASCFSASGSRAGDAVQFPYVAYVSRPDAAVRSGPSSHHYATEKLPVGYAVEVYRHDAEGWCAIRPPEGSFSLVSTVNLKVGEELSAEVSAAGAPARVGSKLDGSNSAVQVLLDAGEQIQLLEHPRPSDPLAKIAPPAGEFRWIAARALSRAAPVEGAPAPTAKKESQDPFAHLAPPNINPALAPILVDGTIWRPVARAGSPVAQASPARIIDRIDVVPGSPAAIQLAVNDAPIDAPPLVDGSAQPFAPSPPSGLPAPAELAAGSTTGDSSEKIPALENLAPPARAPGSPPRIRFSGYQSPSTARPAEPIVPRVAEMQLRLSNVVAKPPGNWPLAALREETAALLAAEQTPVVRDQLRDLLDRIAQFEAIQNRRRENPVDPNLAAKLDAVADRPVEPTRPLAGITGDSSAIAERIRADLGHGPGPGPAIGTGPASNVATTEALYDAVGTLKPVVSRRANAPRFALVDDGGEVVSLVSPTAEVDLRPYVGRRVGVNGTRGFMAELRRSHVAAARVTPLEERMRR